MVATRNRLVPASLLPWHCGQCGVVLARLAPGAGPITIRCPECKAFNSRT